MGTTGGIIVGILILSLLMFIHELGHYISGRLLGFKIIEFSLFMGPVLLSKTSKKTGIKYSLKLFPIGASVRFQGEEGMGEEASDDPDAFNKKEKWKRAVVIATGPIVNIIAGILALMILFGSIGSVTTTVAETATDSQAAKAGILEGDRIVSVNNSVVWSSADYSFELGFAKEDQTIGVKVLRPGVEEELEFQLVPEKKTTYRLGITTQVDAATKQWKVVSVSDTSNGGNPVLQAGDVLLAINGVDTADQALASAQIAGSNGADITIHILRNDEEMTVESKTSLAEFYTDRGIALYGQTGFKAAIGESFRYSASIVKLTFKGLGKIFTGEIAAKDGLSGPVGVVDMVGNVVTQSAPLVDKIANLVWMFALISLNLGVFNLLPIPALDGSHLLLIAVEAVRGKRLSPKVESKIVIAGFLFIIGLAIMGLIFDIMRITGRS